MYTSGAIMNRAVLTFKDIVVAAFNVVITKSEPHPLLQRMRVHLQVHMMTSSKLIKRMDQRLHCTLSGYWLEPPSAVCS